jgi:hypothetical protein
MAKTKYGFEKRQKEKARQKKQEEKVTRRKEAKLSKTGVEPGLESEDTGSEGESSDLQPDS